MFLSSFFSIFIIIIFIFLLISINKVIKLPFFLISILNLVFRDFLITRIFRDLSRLYKFI